MATFKTELSKTIFISLWRNNKSLLQQTQERISFLNGITEPIIICNEEHRFLVAEQMRDINVKPKAIILENEGKILHQQLLLVLSKL